MSKRQDWTATWRGDLVQILIVAVAVMLGIQLGRSP